MHPSAPPLGAALVREALFIRRLLRRYGVPAQSADDLTQTVLMAAWSSMQRGRYIPPPYHDPRRALRAWLIGVVRNLASHYREAAHHREIPTDPTTMTALEAPDLAKQLEARSVLQQIQRLPPELQAALHAEAMGLTFEEAGLQQGIPTSTAAKRLYRARAALARHIRRAR